MTTPRKYRVAMYSPGMVGLGHIRRNASIAQALRRSDCHPSILMIAEARQAGALPMPEGVDCVTLPALCKEASGWIKPRFLDVPNQELVALRSKVISRAVKAFEPDVLIVDHLPLGAAQELTRTLRHIRKRENTRCVLGVRDILQDPETVRQTWAEKSNLEAIREYYDAVWIYGDPKVFDFVQEYGLPDSIAAKASYTGYLDQRPRLDLGGGQATELLAALPPGKIALCVMGGGHDGVELAKALLRAELPPDTTGLIVTGPYMSAKSRRRLLRVVKRHPHMKLFEFVAEPAPFIHRASRVIAMGGYNTICEVLSFEKHALIVPRVAPKPEQWIRAQRMKELGVLDVMHPDELSAEALTEWLRRDLGPVPPVHSRIDFRGLERIPALLAGLLNGAANGELSNLAIPTARRKERSLIPHE